MNCKSEFLSHIEDKLATKYTILIRSLKIQFLQKYQIIELLL